VTFAGWLRRAERLSAENGASFGQVSTGARDEALYLILRTLRLPLDSGPEVLKRPLTAAESAAVGEVLRRRFVERVPAAYITREAWLGGLRFNVDERVLIPRSYFVEILRSRSTLAPRPAQGVSRGRRLHGIGLPCGPTGEAFQGGRCRCIDLSPGALEVAASNVRRHRLSGVSGSCRETSSPPSRGALRRDPQQPALRATAHVDALPEEFRKEPRLALDGGADGLNLVRTLVRQAERLLKPGASL